MAGPFFLVDTSEGIVDSAKSHSECRILVFMHPALVEELISCFHANYNSNHILNLIELHSNY